MEMDFCVVFCANTLWGCQFPVCNTKWLKNGKLNKAMLSAFYNISQRNFGILLIVWCSFKLRWNFCPDLLRSKFCLLRKWSINHMTFKLFKNIEIVVWICLCKLDGNYYQEMTFGGSDVQFFKNTDKVFNLIQSIPDKFRTCQIFQTQIFT
jgi:hypothetical protein